MLARLPKQEFANQLRRRLTPAEDVMYTALLSAFNSYRCTVESQMVVGPYVADFCILPSKLIIEIDGSVHNGKKARAYDQRRTTYLMHRGYRVIRFTNGKVFLAVKPLIAEILKECLPLQLKRPGEIKITYCPPMAARGHWKKRLI